MLFLKVKTSKKEVVKSIIMTYYARKGRPKILRVLEANA
ncbi:hypothetical protein ACVWYG_002046 [Pedobacter sp. UYEF25]